MKRVFFASALLLVAGSLGQAVGAATDCTFSTVGSTLVLDDDCTTDATILIPDGMTLNGKGHMITAVDPEGGFDGAVVSTAGSVAHVTRLIVTASGLANVCKSGEDRLRGILFDSANGSITRCTVAGINKGPSSCQEGNAIEIRNEPFDGTHPAPIKVKVAHNRIFDWQKTGIVANGDVFVSIRHNKVSESSTQANLAANSIQLGFGALGIVTQNHVMGNQWEGWSPTSDFAGSAILAFEADAVYVGKNNIRGNSDVGLFILSDSGLYLNNRVFDQGPDLGGYDIGIWNLGENLVVRNKVRGFDVPYLGGDLRGGSEAMPRPQVFR